MDNSKHFKILHEAFKHHQPIEHCGEKCYLVSYAILDNTLDPVKVKHVFEMDNGAKIVVVKELEIKE